VTKQSSFYASLGLLRCARKDEHCIYMHDLCLARQPYFHDKIDTMHAVHQSCRENAHINVIFDTIIGK